MDPKEIQKLIEQFSFVVPLKGFVLIMKFEAKKDKDNPLSAAMTGMVEESPYGVVINFGIEPTLQERGIQEGNIVMYDEFEGLKVERINKLVNRDDLIIIPEECVIARIDLPKENV